MVILFLTSWGTTTLFSIATAPLYIVTSKALRVLVFLASTCYFPFFFFFSLTYGCHGGCKMVFQGNFDLGIHIFFQHMKGRCGSLPYIISCILLYSATSTLLWPYSCPSIISYLWLAYKLNTICCILEGQAYSRCLLVSYKLNSILNILPAAFYSLLPFLGHYYLNFFSCPASPYLLLNCCLCLQFSVESFLFRFCLFQGPNGSSSPGFPKRFLWSVQCYLKKKKKKIFFFYFYYCLIDTYFVLNILLHWLNPHSSLQGDIIPKL